MIRVKYFDGYLCVKLNEILEVLKFVDVYFEVVIIVWVIENGVSVIVVGLIDLDLYCFCSVMEIVIDVRYYVLLEEFDFNDNCSVLCEMVNESLM